MEKYFMKEMHSELCEQCFEIGHYDDSHTFRDEGVEYLASVCSFAHSKESVSIEFCKDFIDVDEISSLTEISEEMYNQVAVKFISLRCDLIDLFKSIK